LIFVAKMRWRTKDALDEDVLEDGLFEEEGPVV
jgi:hypothetical protein